MSSDSVTIKDIARQLGISKSTVSRALSEHSDVNPETRKKVLELANKLNYQPNAIALHLKQQRTHTIGVVIPEIINRFFAQAIGGIQKVANMAGYHVMICQSDDSYISERKNLQGLFAMRVDGVIVSLSSETDRTDHFDVWMQKNIPLVFFDRIPEEINVSQVFTDNYDISFEGTEHLIEQGCKRIAIIAGPQNLSNSRNRLKGYKDAMDKHGIPVKESNIIHGSFRGANIEEYTRYLINLQPRPDGIFAINDTAAIEMMHVIKKNGLKIPDDIAVLGFNNENICRMVEPSLSSIDHSPIEMGSLAAEMLLRKIETGNLTPEKRLVKGSLVVRESTHKMRVYEKRPETPTFY
jgi:DNA-binding LacI/PurR family transcriptional regulator